jgi:hypothetical protein
MPSAQDPKASLKATPPGSSDIMTAVSQDTASKGTQVKLLVFDMGHVFVDFEWETVCQGFCDADSLSRF